MRWPWQHPTDPDHSTRLPDGRLSDGDTVLAVGQRRWADLLDERPPPRPRPRPRPLPRPTGPGPYGDPPWWPTEHPYHPLEEPAEAALNEPTQLLSTLGPLETPAQQWRSQGR